MKRAYCLIRPLPHYRSEAFVAGLTAAGYEVSNGPPHRIELGDVVATWNRYRENHDICCRVEKAGGVALVAENGYVGSDQDGRHLFALARGGHNGSGWTPTGSADRWNALGIDLKPWRAHGVHVLVAPNRSFGRPDMVMPPNWAYDVARRLKGVTKRPIRVRPHPGNDEPKVPLERDLENCHAVIIWASSVGVKALIEGVPTFVESPFWCMKGAGASGTIDEPVCPERLPHFHRLAYQQWTVAEIASGEAFRKLLS